MTYTPCVVGIARMDSSNVQVPSCGGAMEGDEEGAAATGHQVCSPHMTGVALRRTRAALGLFTGGAIDEHVAFVALPQRDHTR